MKKWVHRICIGILIALVIVLVVINVGMGVMKFSDQEAMEFFQKRGLDGVIEHVEMNGRHIKMVIEDFEEGDSTLMVFVHGAPGTWDAFKDYMVDEDLTSGVRMLAYDRPGYGGSGEEEMPSIQEQANILKEVVNSYGLQRNVLIGHSYGGPIVGKAVLDRRDTSDVAIMIAPLIDPVSEPLYWYSYISYWKWTSWLLPSELVVAGAEKFAHAEELEKMQSEWSNAQSQIIHVHGLEDGLAPGKENIEFSREHIPVDKLETIVYKEKGHLIIWTDYLLMKEMILKTL